MAVACTPEAQQALGLSHKIRGGADTTAPLVVFVHGRAGTQDVMWAFRRCVPEAWTIIAPQAPLPDPVGGFSWWDISRSSAREGGEVAAQTLARFIEGAKSFYGLAPRAIIGCGFSQGAGTLSVVLQRGFPFAGVALLAGFVVEVENPVFYSAKPKVFIAHGTDDEMVPLARAQRGRDFLLSKGATVEYVEDPVGHKVGTTGMRGLTTWFGSLG